MDKPILSEVNIFEGVHCSKFIGHISDLNKYCNWLEQEIERVRQQYKDALNELRFP